MIPPFERAKAFHALGCMTSVIGKEFLGTTKLFHMNCDGTVTEVNNYFLNDRHSISGKSRASYRNIP
jgi:hypothetical protein